MNGDYAVYRVYDVAGECIYVGASINPFARAKQHANGSRWWREASRFEIDWHPTAEEAARQEERLIADIQPRFNRAGVTKRFQPYTPGPNLRPVPPKARPAPTLMAIGSAAEMLNVSVDTIRRWEARGIIAAVRTPTGQRRFSRDDVERLAVGRAVA